MLYSLTVSAQSKQVQFERAVAEIMQCLEKDDLATINQKYIHPGIELFVVYRMGVPDIFYRTATLEKDSVYSSPYFYTASLQAEKRQLKPGKVDFDCDKEQWTRKGFFYQKNVPQLLSNIVKFLKQYELVDTETETLNTIKTIENNSYRIVDTKSSVVFYLTWTGNKWCLTVFDLVSMDCSA
ncbi:MAG: hypothetical protein BGO31_05750 [Bacteroidetes bacterium 43-16]|nr:MAG: hypothetical protein BGO31_05750 [Bacteroidetes bacterium 43-16]